MGGLFRQFWQPALLCEELPAPDCPPVRVRLMGENFVAFRDSSWKVGLLDAHCPHRLAELFFEAGPRLTLDGFERFLDQAIAAGQLDVPDPARAAQHFFCLLKGMGHLKQLCGCQKPVPRKEVAAHIDSVVDLNQNG